MKSKGNPFLYYRDNNATFSIVDGRENNRYNRITMGSDKYRLKWSKYQDNILSTFQSLLETEQLSDVTLFCEGEYFEDALHELGLNRPHYAF